MTNFSGLISPRGSGSVTTFWNLSSEAGEEGKAGEEAGLRR